MELLGFEKRIAIPDYKKSISIWNTSGVWEAGIMIFGLAILTYNLCVMFDILNNRPYRKGAAIVGCC